MAVAFDAVGPGSSGAGGIVPASPITWTHTCAVGATSLHVAVMVGKPGTDTDLSITAVSYNGTSLGAAKSTRHANDSTTGYVSVYEMLTPPSGANTVSVTYTRVSSDPADVVACGSISVTGGGTPTYTSAAGTGTTPSITVSAAAGDLVIDSMVCGSSRSATGQTLRWSRNDNGASSGGNSAQSTAAGSASVVMSHTITSDNWASIGILVPASGAADTLMGQACL